MEVVAVRRSPPVEITGDACLRCGGPEGAGGAAEVDLVGGDEGDELAEGALKLVAGGGKGDGDGLAGDAAGADAGAALAAAEDVRTGGVVVVAEGPAAEGGRAAGSGGRGVRGGKDVAAEDADVVVRVGLGDLVHWDPSPPGGTFLAKV